MVLYTVNSLLSEMFKMQIKNYIYHIIITFKMLIINFIILFKIIIFIFYIVILTRFSCSKVMRITESLLYIDIYLEITKIF